LRSTIVFRRWAAAIGAAVALVVGAPLPVFALPRGGNQPCPDCSLLGSLSVSDSSVEPSQPVVGDTVTITFPIDYQLPGGFDCGFGGSCQFEGGTPYLEGDDPPSFGGGHVTVQRRAVRAGTASVELHVRATTEEQCYFEDPVSGCTSYFQEAFIEASSGPQEIQVFDATPTPTATPTLTPTPTPAQPTAEDDGCAIDRGAHHTSAAVLALPLLPLVLLRRTRRRA
jgi:hypothetical protein